MAEQTGSQPFEGRWVAEDPANAFLFFGPLVEEGQSRPFANPGQGSLNGSDGCNGVGGAYEPDGQTATLTRGPSTLKACIGVDTWLRGAASVRLDGDRLHVFDHNGEEIGVLTRASED
ncbi:MAG TPA: META domain-containing protein [Candidatus Brevibacterium intestinigallinarum]|nr:META domain-containing protein [Candidatus Brevibacterium intestinigallinarum]